MYKIKNDNYFYIVVIICIIFISSCSKGKEDMTTKLGPYTRISDVPNEVWEKLSLKKIYFGHQSVGNNIIDGIKDVMKTNPNVKLNIVETTDLSQVKSGCFAHSKVGKNLDPISKINDFVNINENGIGNSADIAFFKFCYVDISEETDLVDIYKKYKKEMRSLAEKYSKTRFVHVTVPLNSKPKEPDSLFNKIKNFIKTVIGKGSNNNAAAKFEYNEMLRKEYTKEGELFDLALSESINRNGVKSTVIKGNEQLQFLTPEFTNDGGHLNETGRIKVAEDFLIFIVNAL